MFDHDHDRLLYRSAVSFCSAILTGLIRVCFSCADALGRTVSLEFSGHIFSGAVRLYILDHVSAWVEGVFVRFFDFLLV